ncbi:acetyl-CoA synthetase-like protein [Dendrothele bispora CBS 962.96]|uniref:Acetyl-CoA synthetase-like protein n=1 Tax=Dendrothele bispora (strain CBS 962.96) TaxID=1314807 RepID=A0A4S8MXP0_DENBC|nr:acetyl-CoA synthetase-like protein [Dendrothele bispora CBS 962.96]
MAQTTFALPPVPQTQALSSKTFKPPSFDGSSTVIEMLDWHYDHSASHPLFKFAQPDSEEIRTVLWKETIEAVYTGAKLIRDRVQSGLGNVDRKIVGILSLSDAIPYFTTVLSIMRANYIPFPISPRNSPQAVAHLISKVGAVHILVGYDQSMQHLMERAVEFLKEDHGYTSDKIPTTSMIPVFEDLYLNDGAKGPEKVAKIKKEIPWIKLQPQDIQFYMHSSGSTAFPKPVPWTALGLLQLSSAPFFGGTDMTGKGLSLHVLPIFHAMGACHIFWSITAGIVYGTFHPQTPPVQPTPDAAFNGALKTDVDYILAVPHMIEAWSRNPSCVEWLASRSAIMYGGGPLDKEVGIRLSEQGVKIGCAYGLTEAGIISVYPPRECHPDTWDYFSFLSNYNLHLIPSDDNTFELVVLPGKSISPQVSNTKMDGIDAYATYDMIVEHPQRKGFWKILGRADSQIIHTSGEKTNPGPLESIMNQDPHVTAAVMFGHGKFQAGILVEPIKEEQFDPSNEQKLSEFRDKIWPTVEKLNAYAPQHSRVFKELILVASPSKPFTYTAKNTTRNPAIIREYAPEIEALYDSLEESTQASVPAPEKWDAESSTDFARKVVKKVLSNEDIGDEDDLFQNGGDSLQATWIKNSILRALRDSAGIDTRDAGNFVYDCPTIASLGSFIVSVVERGSFGTQLGFEAQVKADVEGMRRMVEKYSKNFVSVKHVKSPRNDHKVVLMTGSTGGVGAHILHRLYEDPTVERVYALIRKGKEDIETKQANALTERGVDASIIKSKKVVLLEANLSAERFGLPENVFKEIQSSLSHIVANAWRVDFNLGLSSFDSDIKGLRNMVDLALATNSLIIFVSSVGIFQRFMYAKQRPFPEDSLPAEIASGGGYAQSKWVSEQIMQAAASTAGLRATVVRLGQACGSPNGSWNSKEWLPAIVRSAPYLKCIPDDNRLMSWIPADMVACALRDFLDVPQTETEGKPCFVHLIHPRPVRWSTLARLIASKLKVDVVPFTQWLEKLEQAGKTEQNAEKKISALRILSSYQGMASIWEEPGVEAFGIAEIENGRAKRLSKTLADPNVPQLGEEQLKKWMSYWGL